MLLRYIRALPFAVLAIGLVFALGPASALAFGPVTLQATEVDNMSADLHGQVSAEGRKTNYAFGWGTTPNINEWKNVTTAKTTESTKTIEVGEKITGLAPSTKYYYALGTLDWGNLSIEYAEVRNFTTRSGKESHGPLFMAAKSPVTISGSLGKKEVFQFISPEWGALPPLECTTHNLSGTFETDADFLVLTPGLGSCTSYWGPSTVKTNGCQFVFNALEHSGSNYSGPFGITCPAKAVIEIIIPETYLWKSCTIKLSSQEVPSTSSLVYENTGPSTARYLSLPTGSASGLKYSGTGSGCIEVGVGASGEASVPSFAGTTLKGTSGGAYDELFVSGE